MLTALDVAIGLALTFTLVSLLASLLNEWISAILRMRGRMLWSALDDLLGTDLGRRLAEHPFLKTLRHRTWLDSLRFTGKEAHRHKIGYLPTATFVRAALAVLKEQGLATPAAEAKPERLPAGEPAALVRELLAEAEGDLETLEKNLAATFETTMSELSSWYKRWSQLVLFFLGLVIAFLLGVDAIHVSRSLAADPELREQVAGQAATYLETYVAQQAPAAGEEPDAESIRQDISQLLSTIEGTGLPLLQPASCRDSETTCVFDRRWGTHLEQHWTGFLLTALATCFGAPFWFDVLKRLVNLRTNVKPEEVKPGDARHRDAD